MEMFTRISAHRGDDGSVVAEYEPRDRCTMRDIEAMVEDMLEAVDDDGDTIYEDVGISPESILINKVGWVTIFELLLKPKTYLRKLPATGLEADEARELRKLDRSMRG